MICFWQASAHARPDTTTVQPRRLLVLYASQPGAAPQGTIFNIGLQAVASYHGLLPLLHDVNKGPLPSNDTMKTVAGIITTFDRTTVLAPEPYLLWLKTQMAAGKRLAVFGDFGRVATHEGSAIRPDLVADILSRIGLTSTGTPFGELRKIRYDMVDKRHVGTERPLPSIPPAMLPLKARPETAVWLSVTRTDRETDPSPYIGIGAQGGFALGGTAAWSDNTGKTQWYLDPFAFLEQALGLGRAPVLTPTTLNGQRVAFSHVDADGFGGFTELSKDDNCATIMRDQIFTQFDFPITVSVIQAETDPRIGGNTELEGIARSIFRLPNVEPGSHSYTHPFYWNPDDSAMVALYRDKVGVDIYGVPVKGYSFDLKTEIVSSCSYITERLSPKEKPCRIIQWSGACNPTEEALRIADKAGLLNINGGDTYTDSALPSIATVSGLVNVVGDRFQFYTGQANENILTNLWTGPFHGYRDITVAMRYTESPRRLMPINIYYHFYSAEKQTSLKALQDVYAWVMAQDIAPVYTSQYLEMVRDWTRGTVSTTPDGHTIVANYGRCLSVRMPDGACPPDVDASQNVLGYAETPAGLYVHLAPGAARAVIVPTDKRKAQPPHIQSASGWIHDMHREAKLLRFRYEGFGKGRITLAGLPGDAALHVALDGQQRQVVTSPEGSLTLENITSGPVEIRLP